MYGDLATKLTLQSKRLPSLPLIPSAPTETILAITREIHDLNTHFTSLLHAASPDGTSQGFNPDLDPGASVALLIDYQSIRWNKRCLLAYWMTRLSRIEGLVWQGVDPTIPADGTSSPTPQTGDGSSRTLEGSRSHALIPEEISFAQAYDDLLLNHSSKFSDIDLRGTLEPPRDLFIDVRVLKDAGTVETEYGSLRLAKNSQFFVREGDVTGLLRAGYLQKLG